QPFRARDKMSTGGVSMGQEMGAPITTTRAYGDKPLDVALGETAAADSVSRPAARAQVDGYLRTTVLPKETGTPAESPAVQGVERGYEVVQVLAQGGMGEVALAEDRDIRRKVAVKRLRSDARSAPA